MTACESNPGEVRGDLASACAAPINAARVTAWQVIVLVALLAAAAALRFHQIGKISMWPDEFWSSIHLATGRGTAIFDLPAGVLIQPPPQTLLAGAPPWWHIWIGLRGIVHPPLYLILLRGWMDLFGSSDLAARSFSAVASVLSIIVLFDVLRKSAGAPAGLIGGSLLAISPAQIDLSQQARPYELLILLAVLTAHALVRIEARGATASALAQLGLCSAAAALTHYFSLGALVAMAAFVLVRFRAERRSKSLAALAIAAAVVLVAWGPFLWQQRAEFFRQQSWSVETSPGRAPIWRHLLEAPALLLYGRAGSWQNWVGPAMIAYGLPLFWLRRFSIALLAWLWFLGTIISILVFDLAHHGRLLEIVKYISIASPAICILCALPIDRFNRSRWGARWAVGYLMVVSVLVAAVQRLQEGPPDANGDWRQMAQALDRRADPHDPLVFYRNSFWGPPGIYYLAFAQYAQDSHRPVMFLNEPADAGALAQLAPHPRVWLVGAAAQIDGGKWLPGWTVGAGAYFLGGGSFAEMRRQK